MSADRCGLIATPGLFAGKMKRLFRSMLVCFIVLTLLCVAAIFIGRRQSNLAIFPDLISCDNSFCYLGISPGKTSWDDGIATLREDPKITAADFKNTFEHSDPNYTIEISPNNANAQIVGGIHLYVSDQSLPIENAVAILGAPCYVTLWGSGNLELSYSHIIFYVGSETYILTPTSSVISIFVHDDDDKLCDKAALGQMIGIYEWRGFEMYK